jgi:hypothetical protein
MDSRHYYSLLTFGGTLSHLHGCKFPVKNGNVNVLERAACQRFQVAHREGQSTTVRGEQSKANSSRANQLHTPF